MDVPHTLYSLTEASDQLYFSYHLEENRFVQLNPAFIDFFDFDVEPILITVADDGIGIPQKYHATLFEQFRTIVEWHDGFIWFDSEEDKGVYFLHPTCKVKFKYFQFLLKINQLI